MRIKDAANQSQSDQVSTLMGLIFQYLNIVLKNIILSNLKAASFLGMILNGLISKSFNT